MFKSLKALLAKPREVPQPKVKATPGKTLKDFRAVSVVPGKGCCQEAKSSVVKRYLLRDAPRLPLSNCTMPANCTCKFKKVSDRRDGDGDRRQIGILETGRWLAARENRIRRNRRSAKD
jgi:hypothetical protein